MNTIATTTAAVLLVVTLTLGLGTVGSSVTSSEAAPASICKLLRWPCKA